METPTVNPTETVVPEVSSEAVQADAVKAAAKKMFDSWKREEERKRKAAELKAKKAAGYTRIASVCDAILEGETKKESILSRANALYHETTGKALNSSETLWAFRMTVQTLEGFGIGSLKGDTVSTDAEFVKMVKKLAA